MRFYVVFRMNSLEVDWITFDTKQKDIEIPKFVPRNIFDQLCQIEFDEENFDYDLVSELHDEEGTLWELTYEEIK